MLELKNISYSIQTPEGKTDIIKNINLTIADGQLVVFTGPNGGGKTTLAKIIMGLVEPTEGSIIWNGEDITSLGLTERALKGISYGFQQPPRFKGIKVRDLLSIASGKRILPKGEACSYLNQVGLCANDYLDRDVDSSLSGGEVKRIEIATILAKNAGLMILDEPEAGIDLWSFNSLIKTFKTLKEKYKCGFIIISHQERILDIADQVIVLANGEVKKIGNKDKVLPYLSEIYSVCSKLEEVE